MTLFALSIIGLIISFLMFVYGLYNDKPTIEIIGRFASPIFGFILGSSFYILFCS